VAADPASFTFTPRCPACRYDLTGLADGLCPECGGPFRHEVLRAEAMAAAAARAAHPNPITAAEIKEAASVIAWGAAFAVPAYFLSAGVLSVSLANRELRQGCYWSDAPSLLPWLPAASTAGGALKAGRVAVALGVTLTIAAAGAWRLARRRARAPIPSRS
jgi:hypothetical protein